MKKLIVILLDFAGMNSDRIQIINLWNWEEFKYEFDPPLIGPYDVRTNIKSPGLDTVWRHKLMIPKLIAYQKYLEAQIEQTKSLCFYINDDHSLDQYIKEDEQQLIAVKNKLKKLIA